MKEELFTLKDSAFKIAKANESLKKQKMFFNMKVEEQKEKENIEEFYNKEEYGIYEDSFEAANMLNELFPQIRDIVAKMRKEHPKYGIKRIKELTLTALTYDEPLLEDSEATNIIDNYFLYEECGFFKLKAQQEELIKLGKEAKETTETIIDQSKQATVKFGTSVANIVKPYGEIAKEQFGDAKEEAKNLINKGSKKLRKILEKVEDKTKNK